MNHTNALTHLRCANYKSTLPCGLIAAALMTVSIAAVANPRAGHNLEDSTHRTWSSNFSEADREHIFQEVCDIVTANFFDTAFNGVDWQQLCTQYRARALAANSQERFARIINELLGRLKVSHTSYHTPNDRAYYELLSIYRLGDHENLRDIFPDGVVRWESIGFIESQSTTGTFVQEVHAGSAAALAGLRIGDRILRIDDAPDFHPVRSLQGKAGQTITITVQRGSALDEEIELHVEVQWIEPARQFLEIIQRSAVIHEHNDRKIGYIRIFAYTSPQIHDAVVDLVNEELAEADALVLDLRGGWGGANPEYLDLFHTQVPQITFITRDGWKIDVDRKWRKPLVLLVDEGTRSGKEIFAHAVRSNNMGLLIGQRTAGAVVGGRPFVLSDGSFLIVATSDVRVDGKRLEGIGVEPHITIPSDLRLTAGGDTQKQRAIEEAARLAR